MLDAGSPTPQIVGLCLCYALTVAMLFLAAHMARYIFVGFGGVLSGIDLIIIVIALALYPGLVRSIYTLRHTVFVVEDGVLDGVDLFNVERVRYGPHCVYLDKVKISGVPQPKVFLKSLEDYYLQLTGVEMP